MNLKQLITTILTMSFLGSFAQIDSKLIEFEETTWNFGEIDEAKGTLSHTYTFTNKSDQDFIINDVQASCGCTTPEWSSKPIKPGGKGFIKANFNPTGMTGEAFKTVIVYGNFKDDVARVLEIKGKIFSLRFGDQMFVAGQTGYLRISDNMLDFGKVLKTQKDTTYAVLVNDGTDTFSIIGFKDVPPYIKLWPENLQIAPGMSGVVYAEIDGEATKDWGDLSHTLYIKTDDRFYFFKEIFLYATLQDDFSKLSKRDRKMAPKIEFDKKSVDFGTVKTGAIKTASFTMTNAGKSTLKIHKTFAVCSCTVLGNLKNEIKPGESVTFNVEFDTVFKSGKQTKAITFYTNDPENPVVEIAVQAVVTDHH
jgi:hypothetical protein